MFGGNTSSTFGSASSPSIFGSSTPAFGASSTPAFGANSTPAFGASSSTPAFGAGTSPSLFGSTTSAFGASSTPSLFGASSTPAAAAPAFGATSTSAFGLSSTPAFGTSTTPLFGGSSAPAFGASATPSTPSIFGAGSSSSLFGNVSTPSLLGSAPQSSGLFGGASQSAFGQPGFGQTPATSFGQTPLFGQSQASPFGATQSPFGQSTPGFGQAQSAIYATPQQTLLQSGQLTTQMAPVAPMSMPLPDRELQAIIDAYKDDPGNSRFAFKHLLLSVTDPSLRIKPVGISDIMWAEAMNKLEGMERSERERLWPELVQGFKDLSRRLKLQDEALAADAQRLQATQTNVKLLQRHFEADTIPWLQRLRQKEQELQRKLLKMMRIVEALEGKGFRIPLTKGEAQLGARLRTLAQQLQGPRAELPRRVDALLSSSRMQASAGGISHRSLLGSGKIDEQSLAEMHKVLQEQTNAIAHLVKVVKRDMRDMEIIVSDASDNQKSDNDFRRKALGYSQSDVYMKPITF